MTSLDRVEILKRLDVASRRGRLPGYQAADAASPALFTVAAHGQPFDAVLLAEYREEGGRGRLSFRARMLRKLPAVFVVILLVTIWPGVYFMDQLIPGEWGWIPTWWWYLPVTVLPIPWIWKSTMRKSRAAIAQSADEQIRKIAAELGGEMI